MTTALRGVARGAALIAAITVLARLAGFARQVAFARAVGPTCVGSTYQTANTIPNILYEIVAGGALASLVVPLLAGPVAAGDAAAVRRTASALLTWTVGLLVPVAALVAVFARPAAGALLGGSRCAGAVDLGARMIVVFAPQIVLYGIGVVLTGVLQSHERFAGPALAPLLSSLVVIAAYLLYAVNGGASGTVAGLGRAAELTLSVGTTLGVAALSLSLLGPLAGLRARPTPAWRFPAGVAHRARRLAVAGFATLTAQQASVAVALRLANDGTAGGTVVVYALAQTVFLLPWATLAVPLSTAAFPRLAAAGDRAFARATSEVTRAVMTVSAAGAAVLIAAATPIARVLVQGVGARADVADLASGVTAFAPGLIGYGLLALLSRALYARHDTRTPAACMVTGWVVVIGADIALSAALPAGDRVLALSVGNTVGMSVAGALLVAGVVRRAGAASLRGVGRVAVVSLVAAGLGGVAGRITANAMEWGGAAVAVGEALLAALATLCVAGVALLVMAGEDVRRGLSWRAADG